MVKAGEQAGVFTFHVPALRRVKEGDATKQTVVLGYTFEDDGRNLPPQGARWEALGPPSPITHFGADIVAALGRSGFCVRTVEMPVVNISPERRELVMEIAMAQARKWASGEELTLEEALAITKRMDLASKSQAPWVRKPVQRSSSGARSGSATSRPIKAFVSYKWTDKERDAWVEQFATDLRTAGIDALLDRWEVKLGESFTEYMASKITEADVVLFIITPQSVTAVEQETGKGGALKFEMQMSAAKAINGEGRVIGIYREGERPPHYLRDRRYIDFRDDSAYKDSLGTLVSDLIGIDSKPPLGGVVRALTAKEKAIEALQKKYDGAVSAWYDANYTHMDDNGLDNSRQMESYRHQMRDLEKELAKLGAVPRSKPF